MAHQEEVEDTARIMSNDWERVQKKTFTRWFNSKLKLSAEEPVENLVGDLADGIKLAKLLEVISDEKLPKINLKIKNFINKCENNDVVLKFLKDKNIKLVNIASNDIADGKETLILGLIWTIILRFSIADISEEGLSSKAGLLLWCQRKTKPYDEVDVKEFTSSWKDGLAFCALIHRHRPDLIDWENLDKTDKRNCLETAFNVAEQELGIPALLDATDILDMPKPDERSIMTYVSSYFHYFSQFNKFEVAGRRIGKFIAIAKAAMEMQHDYERRAQALIDATSAKTTEYSNPSFDGTYEDCQTQIAAFTNFKKTDKREWVQERQALEVLLGSIQAKLHASQMPPYTPPAGLTSPDVADAIAKLDAAVADYKLKLTLNVREVKTNMMRTYADLANAISADIKELSVILVKNDGDFESRLQEVNGVHAKVDELAAGKMVELVQANDNCEATHAPVEENEFTVYTVDDLQYEMDLLTQNVKKLTAYIENQIVASQMKSVSPDQLQEFEETFRHFDKDGSNFLSALEFKSALHSLGKTYPDDEFAELFKSIAAGDDQISFEEFVQFMVTLEEDKFTAEQIKESFQTLAQGKPYLGDTDLKMGGFSEEDTIFIEAQIPKTDEGYDYDAYLGQHFSQ